MMRDHAHKPPSRTDIRAMLAYHMAMRRDEPFVVITNAGSFVSGDTPTLRGEADPDAEVHIQTGSETLAPKRDGAVWRLPDAPDPPLTVTAQWKGKTRRIELTGE